MATTMSASTTFTISTTQNTQIADLAFPHGESHDGSPGFDDFHKAKSFEFRFSLRRSSETLRSPDKCKHPANNTQYSATPYNMKYSYIMPPVINHVLQILFEGCQLNHTHVNSYQNQPHEL